MDEMADSVPSTNVILLSVRSLEKPQTISDLKAKDLDLLLPGMPRGDAPPQLTPRTVARIVEGRSESKESK